MANILVKLLYIFIIGSIVTEANYKLYKYHIPHAVALHHTNFDKVVANNNVTVVFFVNAFNIDIRHTEFHHFAEGTLSQPQVLAATVGVTKAVTKGFENEPLLERYNISKDHLPVIKLFVRGEVKGTLSGDMKCNKIKALVKRYTGLWVGQPGALEYLDALAEDFTKAPQDEQRKMKELAVEYRDTNTTTDDNRNSAQYYIRVMEQLIMSGKGFLGLESGRLKAMHSAHKHKEDYICGIEKQMNILSSFKHDHLEHLVHDEL